VVFKLVSQNGKEEFYFEKVEDPSIHKISEATQQRRILSKVL